MNPIASSANSFCFWLYSSEERAAATGTAADAVRKFELVEGRGALLDGMELLLFPRKISSPEEFTEDFCERYSRTKYRSVHIGDADPDFLQDTGAGGWLRTLAIILNRLSTKTVVLHARNLRSGRDLIRTMFGKTLPGVDILVENNGFDDPRGHSIEELLEIFRELPFSGFCLDIAHTRDIPAYTFSELLANKELSSRLRQIHFSYSTHHLDHDPYERLGYPGYKPYHGLFSLLGVPLSAKMRDFVRRYPVVIEGVIPTEDVDLNWLKKEAELLR